MEAESEDLSADISRVEKENIAYFDAATQFKQTYTVVEQLEKRVEQLDLDIIAQQATTQEISETDEELDAKIRDHDKHKLTLEREKAKLQNILNEDNERLGEARRNLVQASTQQGTLQAEAVVCSPLCSIKDYSHIDP
jgi:DNA repair protein RAD50